MTCWRTSKCRSPPLLDASVLDELTAEACEAVTGRQDAAALLRSIEAANLFIVALDDDRTSYRYHHLVHQVLRAEHDPAEPAPLDLTTVDPSLLARAPDRLLAVAADLLLWGDWARAGEYLSLLEHTQPEIPPDSRLAARLAAARALHSFFTGDVREAVRHALAARGIEQRTLREDEWNIFVPGVLLRAYTWLEDFEAVDREAAGALANRSLPEPVKRVRVLGAQALAWFGAGRLAEAADAARAADASARRLGFGQHAYAVDYLRAMAGAALERRDLDAAEHLTERALSISEHGRPAFEYLALLDRAEIWAARGQIREALATVETARRVLPGTKPLHLARADELEAQLRLALGDLRSPAELASGLPAARRGLLLARTALAAGDHHAALRHLDGPSLGDLTPRAALVRQILLAACAIQRGEPRAAGILGGVLETARHEGYLNTIVTTAPEVTRYLVEHSAQTQPEAFLEQIITAAMEVRAAHTDAARSAGLMPEPLTAAQLRVLKLLPTTTYSQIAATLYISHNTVKSHLQSIFQKLGVSSRAQAIERAVALQLL
jgi:LuxR family transcriptional regulator, maltose regulon positive regulatory protein